MCIANVVMIYSSALKLVFCRDENTKVHRQLILTTPSLLFPVSKVISIKIKGLHPVNALRK
jgi:hypothetical protein